MTLDYRFGKLVYGSDCGKYLILGNFVCPVFLGIFFAEK